MGAKLEIIEAWRRENRLINGRTPLFHVGVYRVPQDIEQHVAERAVKAGAARWLEGGEALSVDEQIELERRLEEGRKRSASDAGGASAADGGGAAPMTAEPPPLPKIPRRWEGETVVVAATGPSLTPDVAKRCKGFRVIAVNDAWRLFPTADVLYAADAIWWKVHKGVPDFGGERWTTISGHRSEQEAAAAALKLHTVPGRHAEEFSTDGRSIHYGANSGFQAVNLAILFGAARIVLVGFDMRVVDGKRHFFGDHPKPLRQVANYDRFVRIFARAAQSLPAGVAIINATPGSALTCFPQADLDHALAAQTPSA